MYHLIRKIFVGTEKMNSSSRYSIFSVSLCPSSKHICKYILLPVVCSVLYGKLEKYMAHLCTFDTIWLLNEDKKAKGANTNNKLGRSVKQQLTVRQVIKSQVFQMFGKLRVLPFQM